MPQRAETSQVFGRTIKSAQKPRERGLAGHALDLHAFVQERVATQMGNMCEIVGSSQNPRDEPKSNLGDLEGIGTRAHM